MSVRPPIYTVAVQLTGWTLDRTADIPKSHRYVNRPDLKKVLKESVLGDRKKRNKKIIEVVQKYGYTQRQIAAHLQMHYSTISNLVRGKA